MNHQEIGADEHLEQELQKGRTKEQGVGHLYGNHRLKVNSAQLPIQPMLDLKPSKACPWRKDPLLYGQWVMLLLVLSQSVPGHLLSWLSSGRGLTRCFIMLGTGSELALTADPQPHFDCPVILRVHGVMSYRSLANVWLTRWVSASVVPPSWSVSSSSADCWIASKCELSTPWSRSWVGSIGSEKR